MDLELQRYLLKRDGPRHQQLSGEVYDGIWKEIVSGRYLPGQKLLDIEIAKEWEISRTPVREALQQLARDGLVEYKPRRGFYVKVFERVDIENLYDYRAALESMAIKLAIAKLQERDLERMLDQIEAVRSEMSHAGVPVEQFLASDLQLHELIVRAADNERITDALANIQVQLSLFQVGSSKERHVIEASLDEHERILKYLVRRDDTTARALMETHIQRSKERAVAAFFG